MSSLRRIAAHGPEELPGTFADRQCGIRAVFQCSGVNASEPCLFVLVGDNRVKAVPEPVRGPLLLAGFSRHQVGIEHPGINNQPAARAPLLPPIGNALRSDLKIGYLVVFRVDVPRALTGLSATFMPGDPAGRRYRISVEGAAGCLVNKIAKNQV